MARPWYEDPAYMTKDQYEDATRRRNLHAWTQWRSNANDRIIQGRHRNPGPPLRNYLEGDRARPMDADPVFGLMGYSAEYNKATELPRGNFLEYGIPRARVNPADGEFRRFGRDGGSIRYLDNRPRQYRSRDDGYLDGMSALDDGYLDHMFDNRPRRREFMDRPNGRQFMSRDDGYLDRMDDDRRRREFIENEPLYGRVLPKHQRQQQAMNMDDPYGRLPPRRGYPEEDPFGGGPVSPRMARRGPPGSPPPNGLNPRQFDWGPPGYGPPPREFFDRQPRAPGRPPPEFRRRARSLSGDRLDGRRPSRPMPPGPQQWW